MLWEQRKLHLEPTRSFLNTETFLDEVYDKIRDSKRFQGRELSCRLENCKCLTAVLTRAGEIWCAQKLQIIKQRTLVLRLSEITTLEWYLKFLNGKSICAFLKLKGIFNKYSGLCSFLLERARFIVFESSLVALENIYKPCFLTSVLENAKARSLLC